MGLSARHCGPGPSWPWVVINEAIDQLRDQADLDHSHWLCRTEQLVG